MKSRTRLDLGFAMIDHLALSLGNGEELKAVFLTSMSLEMTPQVQAEWHQEITESCYQFVMERFREKWPVYGEWCLQIVAPLPEAESNLKNRTKA